MTSRGHKIFQTHSQQPIQGRNANIANSMIKKAQIAYSNNLNNTEIAPFSNLPTSQSSLATSQVTELMSTNDNLRQLIKQEMEKKMKEDKQRSDVGIMKAQIRSLKQSFQLLSKDSMQKLHDTSVETKEDIQNWIQKLIKDNEKQRALNLKKVMNKMHEQIKKDMYNYIARQTISLNFVDDVQKQFNQIFDKIDLLESKLQGNQKQSFKEKDPVILAETFELRMNKLDRQFDSIKKLSTESVAKIKNQQQVVQHLVNMTKQQKDTVKFEIERLKQSLKDQEVQFKKITNLQLANEAIKMDIQHIKNKLKDYEEYKESNSGKITEMTKKYSNFEDQIKGIAAKTTEIAKTQQQLSKAPQKTTNQIINRNATIIISINVPGKEPQTIQLKPGPKTKENLETKAGEQVEKIIYRLDKDGYLMDSDGNYLVDENNSMILLTNEKIKLIEQSQLIQFAE